MSLHDWMEKEFELKKEFLTKEAEKGEIIRRDNIDRTLFTFVCTTLNPSQLIQQFDFQYDQIFSWRLIIDNNTFELLKKRFRTFKFQKNNKTEGRIKLQIHLKKKNRSHLDQICKDQKFKDLEECLEFLMNKYNTIQQEHTKEIDKLKAEIKIKTEAIAALERTNAQQRKAIKYEQNNKMKSRDDLVNYLKQVAINANCKLAEYELFIKNQPDLETKVVPPLSQEEAQKIKTEFEKELEQTRLSIYVLNSPAPVEDINNLVETLFK